MNSLRASAPYLWNVSSGLFLTAVLGLVLYPVAEALNAIAGGAISGVVTDPSGAVVKGVNVTLTNESTGVQQATQTNSTGLYSFSSFK